MARRTCSLLGAFTALLLAGCATGQGQYYGGDGAPSTLYPGGLVPGETATVGGASAVAILAPLTGPNAERGATLVRAAQLALAAPGSPSLDVRDTGGTPAGAASAARAAIGAGDRLILGPLTAAETAAAAAPAKAAGVAMLAFTNDSAQAQPGVWTLGLTPAQQVARLVAAASEQGKTRFAAVLPQNEFGNAMGAALTQAAAAAGAPAPDIRFHGDGNAAIAQAMRDVSDYANRRGPIDAKIKADKELHTAQGRGDAADQQRRTVPPPPFDALLLADTGEKLAWLSTFLTYYDIDSSSVRLMGPALWAQPSTRAGASVGGAWYAAPDPAARSSFDASYAAKYGAPPPGLADFAFDAASMARVMAQSGGISAASLTRPDGFAGVDGVLTLQPDGSVRRGLALFEVHGGGSTMVAPAPASLAPPGT